MAKTTLFIGQLIHSKGFNELEVVPKGFVAVQHGKVSVHTTLNLTNCSHNLIPPN